MTRKIFTHEWHVMFITERCACNLTNRQIRNVSLQKRAKSYHCRFTITGHINAFTQCFASARFIQFHFQEVNRRQSNQIWGKRRYSRYAIRTSIFQDYVEFVEGKWCRNMPSGKWKQLLFTALEFLNNKYSLQ